MAVITALSVFLTALFVAPCAAAEDPVALLQGKVSVHESSEWHTAKGKYLVDNRFLKHKGPGVLWRRTKSLDDTLGRDQYAAWGSIVDGMDTGDGWVRVGKYFLPTKIHGKQVVTPEDVQESVATRLKITYSPTEIKAQDGSWIPCNIISIGKKKGTFNVEVTPKKFANYTLTDVSADMLKKVHRMREFVPVPVPAPAPAPLPARSSHAHNRLKTEKEVDHELEQEVEGFLVMKVKDTKGEVMELKTLKKSPLRTMMKMACERVGLTWPACKRKIIFKRKGVELNEDDHPYRLGMVDGEALQMVEKEIK